MRTFENYMSAINLFKNELINLYNNMDDYNNDDYNNKYTKIHNDAKNISNLGIFTKIYREFIRNIDRDLPDCTSIDFTNNIITFRCYCIIETDLDNIINKFNTLFPDFTNSLSKQLLDKYNLLSYNSDSPFCDGIMIDNIIFVRRDMLLSNISNKFITDIINNYYLRQLKSRLDNCTCNDINYEALKKFCNESVKKNEYLVKQNYKNINTSLNEYKKDILSKYNKLNTKTINLSKRIDILTEEHTSNKLTDECNLYTDIKIRQALSDFKDEIKILTIKNIKLTEQLDNSELMNTKRYNETKSSIKNLNTIVINKHDDIDDIVRSLKSTDCALRNKMLYISDEQIYITNLINDNVLTKKDTLDINNFTKKNITKKLVYSTESEYIYNYIHMKNSRRDLHNEFKATFNIIKRMVRNTNIPVATPIQDIKIIN